MSQHIAIVGSRGYPDLDAVARFVADLPDETIVVTGGARGVDEVAEQAARARGFDVRVFKPNYELYKENPKIAPLKRNLLIAARCDRLIAFWDGASRGTAHVVNVAKKLGREVQIIRP